MAASSNMKRHYHVFLSFRGTDVRQGFLSHLYAALDQKGIYTFVDSEELRKGEEISLALIRAIEESHVAIIVFSEHYASSRWCLEELLKIMECKEKNGLKVFPVFYRVEPREVREGRDSYKRAMDNHESKLGKDSEKVKRWKKALYEAGSLSGWELNDRDEADLIQCIVKELSIRLNQTPLHVAKYPVGIDSRVQKLICLSQKESADDDVLMIGLWGPGGIGKTAIAKALYNAMMRQFQVMDAVKAIVLNLATPKEMTISPCAFKKMKRLRMLILHKVHISSQGPVRLPNALRWLEWPNALHLEFGPGPKKLARLRFQNSHIKQLVGNCQNFICLKSIEFRDCKSLASIPDISSAPLLESLDLFSCKSLVEVHQSVGDLDKLKHLNISSCSNLRIFPNTLKTKSLQWLDFSGCSKLEKCPDILEKMEHLIYFFLKGTAIKELPASIENLVSIEQIDLGCCNNLTRLPSSIHKLKNLKSLVVSYCSNFVMFPKNLEDSIDPDDDLGFPSLRWLDLSHCNLSKAEFLENASSCPILTCLNLTNNKFTHLPTCINKYDYWKDLFVYSCKQSKGVSVADASSPKEVEILVNGREMPEWILHCKEDTISFMVPPDLCDKILGLAICVILRQNKKGSFDDSSCSFDISLFVNGIRSYYRLIFFDPLESDHVSLVYFPSNRKIEEKPLQNGWSHIQVCVRALEGTIKKRGFRLICEQHEDDLRVCFPTPSADGNRLEFQGKILEGRQLSTDTEEENSPLEQNSTKKMRWS